MDSVYNQFALLLMFSALVGALAAPLHQPVLAAYLSDVLVTSQ